MKQVLQDKNLRNLALINFFYGLAQAILAMRATFLAASGVTPIAVGIVFSVSGFFGAVSPFIGGVLADKFFTRYKVFIVAVVGFGLVSVLIPISASVEICGILGAMILVPMINLCNPVGTGMLQTCSINATNGLADVDYSYLRFFMSTGYTLGTIALTPIVSGLGIQAPFYLAGLSFAFVLAFRRTLKDNETDRTETRVIDKKTLDVRAVYKNYYVVTFVALSILYAAASCCSNNINYLVAAVGADVSDIGLVSGLKVIGEITIMLVFPWFRKHISLSGLQLLAGICLGVCALLQTHAHSLTEVILFEMVGGMGNGIALSSAGHYLRAMVPRGLEATAISLWTVGTNTGAILIPVLLGMIINSSGIIEAYRWTAALEFLWVALFLGSLLFGKFALKKKNFCNIFLNKRC